MAIKFNVIQRGQPGIVGGGEAPNKRCASPEKTMRIVFIFMRIVLNFMRIVLRTDAHQLDAGAPGHFSGCPLVFSVPAEQTCNQA